MFKDELLARGYNYAQEITDGKILANAWIKAACARFLREIDQVKAKESNPINNKYYFDEAAALRVCRFFEGFVFYDKNPRTQYILPPWQAFALINVFGWKHKDTHTRRFRKLNMWVARKNGKSYFSAILSLYMLCADGEPAAQVATIASTQAQTKHVYQTAKKLAQSTPYFMDHFGISIGGTKDDSFRPIVHESSHSTFEALTGKVRDGHNFNCVTFDEVHEYKTLDNYESVSTGFGARSQPLLVTISTAGTNIGYPAFEMFKNHQRNTLAALDNDEFSLVYGLDDEDDWQDTQNLIKANPNLGLSISEKWLQEQIQEAIDTPRRQSSVIPKHLNRFHGHSHAYYDIKSWFECADETLKEEDFHGQQAFLGLDLSKSDDMTSINILIPTGDDNYITFSRNYLPETKCAVTEQNNYATWVAEGHLTTHHGSRISFIEVEREIRQLCKDFDVQAICFDPYYAEHMMQSLMNDENQEYTCIEVPQRLTHMHGPMTHLDILIVNRRIKHNNNPVLNWAISNVTERNHNGLRAPQKNNGDNSQKIDSAVALITALHQAMSFTPVTDYDYSPLIINY